MEKTSTPLCNNDDSENTAEFRVFPIPEPTVAIPLSPYKREATDVPFLIILVLCIIAFVPFAIYTSYQTDSDRFLRGYDVCGNICGRKKIIKVDNCSSSDLSYMTYGRTDNQICVSDCPKDEYFKIGNRCFPRNDTEEIDLGLFMATCIFNTVQSRIYFDLLSFVNGLGICLFWFWGIHLKTKVVGFGTLITSIILVIILTTLSWIDFANSDIKVVSPVLLTIALICLILGSYSLFKRIHLIIRIFKEAANVIADIPSIIIIPILNCIILSILVSIFMCSMFTVWFGSGVLELNESLEYIYVFNGLIIFTIIFGTFLSYWLFCFWKDCQYLIISNIVASHYFARNKSTIRTSIWNSCYSLFRYHLGTVALGSLLLPLVSVVRYKLIVNFLVIKPKFISKNAHIQTALHGQSLFKSLKRVVELKKNASDFMALSSLETIFIRFLSIAQLNLILLFLLIHFYLCDITSRNFSPFGILFPAILADCLFSGHKSVLRTIHMCVCEDNCMNDGATNPYYMTTNVMEYIKDAKKFKR